MKPPKKEKIIYYSDPLNDDFAETNITTERVDNTFTFHNPHALWRGAAFLTYYSVAVPLVFLYTKLIMGLRIKNRKAFRKAKGGAFLYGNHTQMLDPFIPPMITFPRRAFTVANADAVSIKGIRQLVMMIGCLPLPTHISGMRKFTEAVALHIEKGAAVAIYPEAHIWPYYTGVRPFTEASFGYPAKMMTPVIAMAVTYRKRLFFKKPRVVVTLSDPIYPDLHKSVAENRTKLRNEVYSFLKTQCEDGQNYAFIRYEYRPKEDL